MFGTFRYLLAHMVVVSHLWRAISIWAGTYAVFSFFLLSGYLMALVLHSTYGFTTSLSVWAWRGAAGSPSCGSWRASPTRSTW